MVAAINLVNQPIMIVQNYHPNINIIASLIQVVGGNKLKFLIMSLIKKASKKNIIKILIFLLALMLILFLFLYFLSRPEQLTDEPLIDKDEPGQPVLIPLEFLSEEELSDLGVNPNIRAQVISRDPLIYKVINTDEDIIEDIAPFLEPIRE